METQNILFATFLCLTTCTVKNFFSYLNRIAWISVCDHWDHCDHLVFSLHIIKSLWFFYFPSHEYFTQIYVFCSPGWTVPALLTLCSLPLNIFMAFCWTHFSMFLSLLGSPIFHMGLLGLYRWKSSPPLDDCQCSIICGPLDCWHSLPQWYADDTGPVSYPPGPRKLFLSRVASQMVDPQPIGCVGLFFSALHHL